MLRRWEPWLGVVLSPMAVMAFGLALWALGAEMAWAGRFPINSGFFSNWRAWLMIAAALVGAGLHIQHTINKQ